MKRGIVVTINLNAELFLTSEISRRIDVPRNWAPTRLLQIIQEAADKIEKEASEGSK